MSVMSSLLSQPCVVGSRRNASRSSTRTSARPATGSSSTAVSSFTSAVLGSTVALRSCSGPASSVKAARLRGARAQATPAAADDSEGTFLGVSVTTLKKGAHRRADLETGEQFRLETATRDPARHTPAQTTIMPQLCVRVARPAREWLCGGVVTATRSCGFGSLRLSV